MTAVIEESLRQMPAQSKETVSHPPTELIAKSGNGVQPGVDLDDSADLLDLMEQDDNHA